MLKETENLNIIIKLVWDGLKILGWSLFIIFVSYLLFIFLISHFDKKKTMKKILIRFPSVELNEQERYRNLMKGVFGQFWELLRRDRMSFEIHKTGEFIDLVLGVSNPKLIESIKNHLTSIDKISLQNVPDNFDPLNNYKKNQVSIRRLVLEHDYYTINLTENGFFSYLINNLASLSQSQFGSIVCVFRPVKKSKKKEIENQITKRDELSTVEYNKTNLQDERGNLLQKVNSNLFQAEIYTIGNSGIIADSLASTFQSLNEKNRFLIKKVSNFEDLKNRNIGKENLLTTCFRKWCLGSFLSAEELSVMFHPSYVDRGRFRRSELIVLEASPEFLQNRNDNILVGESMTKRGEKVKVYLPEENLERHIYLAGKTGMGKSTFLIILFLSLLQNKYKDQSLFMLDPHGSDIIKIAERIKDRDDLVYFNFADSKKNKIITINPLFSFRETNNEKMMRVQQIMQVLREASESRKQGLGTSIERIMGFLIETGVHFADAYFKYLTEELGIEKQKAEQLVYEKQLTLPDLAYAMKKSGNYQQLLERIFKNYPFEIGKKWTIYLDDYKTNQFVADGVDNRFSFIIAGNMIAVFEGNKFKISDLVQQKKKVLLPITEQSFGVENKNVFSKIILSEIWLQAIRITYEEDRHDVACFIDEFQEVQMPIIDKLLAQARKYRIKLILGNQFTDQLNTEIKKSILNNPSTFLTFSTGSGEEARKIAQIFNEKLKSKEITSLPPFGAYMKTLEIVNDEYTDNLDRKETSFMSFNTIRYDQHFDQVQDKSDLDKLSDKWLDIYGEDVDELYERHNKKIEDAEKYFLEGVFGKEKRKKKKAEPEIKVKSSPHVQRAKLMVSYEKDPKKQNFFEKEEVEKKEPVQEKEDFSEVMF